MQADPEILILDDEETAQAAVEDAFRSLAEALGPNPDLEPILWSWVNAFHRRTERLRGERDRFADQLKTLREEFDGSEVADMEMQEALAAYQIRDERIDWLQTLQEAAGLVYEDITDKPWFPRSGSRPDRKMTAAYIDARDFVKAAREREAAAKCPDGKRIIIAGDANLTDYRAVWAALDRQRDRHGDIVLLHGGRKTGCDHIAALWAHQRNVPQVAFAPDFKTHGPKRAGFERNLLMLKQKPIGVILFGGTGVQSALEQEAVRRNIPIWKPEYQKDNEEAAA